MGKAQAQLNNMGLTPKEIVKELDRFIIGQGAAKKAVAIALRNRYRRKMIPKPMHDEIVPKNILMVGPTGVGKTEIARRLAKLSDSPFIKIEATKFTEVGYVGRDVESIIRDLVEIAIASEKVKAKKSIKPVAEEKVIEIILDALVGKSSSEETREKFYKKIMSGKLEDQEIEIDLPDTSVNSGMQLDIPGMPGSAMSVLNISDMLGKVLSSKKTKPKTLAIKDAKRVLIAEESDKLIDQEKVLSLALSEVENNGIVFLDEIDKIASRSDKKSGEVSREGVQRDLLPLIEGTNVNTKYGAISTNHILFISSGAFHLSKPSDLLPELQGRFPIRVELSPLTKQDLMRILTEPESSLIKQYKALLATENISLEFTDKAIDKLASIGINFNSEVEDIGARRLHTILEKLLEDISFNSHEMQGQKVVIDERIIDERLSNIFQNINLSKFIL
ncbi:MAG: ATP-dependent protease ATPase subunit HslU [Rickettsiaceae bacterium]